MLILHFASVQLYYRVMRSFIHRTRFEGHKRGKYAWCHRDLLVRKMTIRNDTMHMGHGMLLPAHHDRPITNIAQ